MISRLDELNRIIFAIITLVGKAGAIDEATLIEYCNTGVFEGRLPDHKETILYCEQIGLIVRQEQMLVPTKLGCSFHDFNADKLYQLTVDQKQLLLRNCFLHGALRRRTFSIFKRFSEAFDKNTFRFSFGEERLVEDEAFILEHLRQLGVLKREARTYEVDSDYVATIADFLGEGAGWSEEQFKQYLREKEEVGGKAEELALKFEEARLIKSGFPLEASCARRISNLRINAGYDLESFNGKSAQVKFDRFIEVKGARGTKVRFFWSDNERQVAKKLGKNYWIYFIGGISLTENVAPREPIMIHDPFHSLPTNAKWHLTPHGLIVEAVR